MANVIPMSGLGSRFSDAQYLLPKPLIPVNGRSMILSVIDALPKSDKWIFIVRQEHIDKFQIDRLLTGYVPGAIIIPEANPTGQAPTCMLAMPHLKPGEDMFVAACDNSFLYHRAEFERLKADSTVDAVIWTFTKNRLLTEKPESWGWVKLAADGLTIDDMSVKIPVSALPFNDHAVVAAFYFKRADEFEKAYELMVKDNYRVNGEFYVDSMPIFYKRLGKRSVIFDVDLYVGWGKPKDLYHYELMAYLCRNKLPLPAGENGALWNKFFSTLT